MASDDEIEGSGGRISLDPDNNNKRVAEPSTRSASASNPRLWRSAGPPPLPPHDDDDADDGGGGGGDEYASRNIDFNSSRSSDDINNNRIFTKTTTTTTTHTAAAAAAAAASSSSLTTTFDRASLIASLRPGTNIAGLSDYEILRVQRIQRNEAKLASLGLLCITSKPTSSSSGIRGKGSTDNVPFQTPPNPTEPESEPESEPVNSKCSSPGPGWTYPPDENFSRHWTSPTRKISFRTHPAACQFEELRNRFGNDEVQAWEEYRKLNPFLENTIVTPEKYVDASRRGRGLTTTRAAAPAQNAIKRGPSNEAAVNCISNNNLCFMCKDGGDLVLCDTCPKAFHMICHIPRLHGTPPGKWSCCECKASLFTRKQRCGECMECLRPNCGECAACKGKKQFGGDGRYGSACKFRKCRFMRSAPPESIPKSPSLITNSESPGTKNKTLPGVGWKAMRVFESGQYVCHWISPTRQIEFKRHSAACNFERLRIKFGSDEVKAWETYRAQCTRKGIVTRVVSPRDYDAKSRSVSTASRARRVSGRTLLSKPRKNTSDGQQLRRKSDNHPSQNVEAKNDVSKSPSLGTTLGQKVDPPGPGWKLKSVCESGRVKTYFMSPMRQIEFRRRKEASDFERLRIEFGSNEVEAWEEASRARRAPGRTISSKPRKNTSDGQQMRRKLDNHTSQNVEAKNDVSKSPSLGTTLGQKVDPPGPGWESSLVDAGSQVVTHWISPVRRIEFRRHTAACNFERLRNEFGSDEVEAWEEYRRRTKGIRARVVSSQDYDAKSKSVLTRASRARRAPGRTISSKPRKNTSDGQQMRRKSDNHTSPNDAAKNDVSKPPSLGTNSLGPKKNPPGPGWESSLVDEGSQVVTHWISPVRRIEFRRHTAACNFEWLRNEFGSDEVEAWEEFRKRYYAVEGKRQPSYVVSPQDYDAHPKGGVVQQAGPNKKRQRTRDHAVCLASVSRKRPRHSTMNKKRESFESDDVCYNCDDGGELVLCDFCPKAFHLDCHIPKLHVIPPGEWRCCECSAVLFKRKLRCGCCDACLRSDACGECAACKTKQRFGGTVKRGGKQCELRQCRDKRYAAPETLPKCNVSRSPNTSGTSICNTGRATTKRKGQRRPVAKSIVKFSGGQHHDSRFRAPPCQSYSELQPFRGLNSGEIKVICMRPANKMSFFGQWFSKRILRIEKSLRDVPPQKSITVLNNEKSGGKVKGKYFATDRKIDLLYIGLNSLETELERLCAFSSLAPEKAVARLGHLQSEAQNVLYIYPHEIERIEEKGHEGCGFFPDGYFDGKVGGKFDSVQVRILGPTLGMAKAVIIKNVFPSEENKQLGRFLDPVGDARDSWTANDKRPLSDMYQRMLVGYGVKTSVVDEYAQSARNPIKLKHGHFKGCVDPTGALPENKVFISGYTTDASNNRVPFGEAHSRIFLSRSPCLAPTDAKMVSVVGSKPEEMSMDDWNILCSYGFGTIIFPQSLVSMACIIADGDLDGDDYFVLWDERLIRQLSHCKDERTSKARALLHKLELPKKVQHSVNKATEFSPITDSEWLSKAQDLMLDFPMQLIASDMVSKLYNLCVEASKRDDDSVDLCDEDAVAYASAYKDAMDVQKHGGQIYLPQHLHINLPKGSRHILTSYSE
ncbi:hypothetical protein ACHAWU_005402 [Discostella pseudostelligera]|uniref:RNA-directed RNA polymerase n=1 Tax=Discostella pseudostelligera TaxID=259834 RepID=A0ABD3MS20_9STRA